MTDTTPVTGEERCPGGTHRKATGDLCCDACWERLPAKIDGRPWKRARIAARKRRGWHEVERINERVRRWLEANPLEVEATR
jgi:hypothetical protein